MEYEPVIGLEVHVQLNTKSKMFCSCGADYQSAEPNTRVCPVCLALPGVLPVVNSAAVESAIKIGLALNCEIAELTKFDRKNYPYPDLMKGYQISQFDVPICHDGWMSVQPEDGPEARIGVTRVHMEEDVARLIHVDNVDGRSGHAHTLMDINRAGVPLMEVVSEPDIRSSAQAEAYILKLQNIIRYLGVGTASMEEGSFRVDANVSVRPVGSDELRERVEVKNMNRVRAVVRAIDHEIERQTRVWESGDRVEMETRGWDDVAGATLIQRSKEEAHDYRYFPEPDIPPLEIGRAWVEEIRASLPEFADDRRTRFQDEYDLSEYDAALLTTSRATADYFEEVVAARDLSDVDRSAFAKEAVNWVSGELARLLNAPEGPSEIDQTKIKPKQLAALVALFQARTISNANARQVLEEMWSSGSDPDAIVKERGLLKVSGTDELLPVVREAIENNPNAVEDFLSGKETAVRFLVGQVMKATRGRADAGVAADLLTQTLEEVKSAR
ncbi:MAG: Asp-tRNA(Asn)/Glu-tRNA(Gln) amidotransferase subunit GatB [Chloroflexi bacterium]|nr:Asp-tRNA(Asn)/Glu-tRNA(Gln) amidotransferase subunit GatB [Chloroflexota bacterium]